jgi:hypothetical protein
VGYRRVEVTSGTVSEKGLGCVEHEDKEFGGVGGVFGGSGIRQNDKMQRDYKKQFEALLSGRKKLEEEMAAKEKLFRDLQDEFVRISEELKTIKGQYES